MSKEEKGLTTEMSQEEINEIRQFTGEKNISRGPKVPFLIFDGNTGMFSKVAEDKDENGETVFEELGKEIECTIIRCRKQIGSGKNSKTKVYSSEFESYNDEVDIIDRETNTRVDRATYSELKEKYGKDVIKLNEIVYLFYNDELFRLSVKGTSLAPLWNYLSSFKTDDTVLRYITKIYSIEESNSFGDFSVMTFKKNGEVKDWRKFWDQLKDLNSSFTNTIEKKIDMLPNPDLEEEVIEEPKEEDYDDEEINVGDIPF
ncbi:MAG: hypothetical protein M0R03_21950 [Novosphingobium sp.]|nr:hypothetical protein [Novosphingobium sp.]